MAVLMTGLDLSECVHQKRRKHLVHTFCILSYSLYFFKSSSAGQDVEFHIDRSHMKIGSS